MSYIMVTEPRQTEQKIVFMTTNDKNRKRLFVCKIGEKKSGKGNVGRPPLPEEPIRSALAPPTSAQVAAAASARASAATNTAEESSRLLTSAAVSAAAGMVLAQAEVAAVAAAAAASTAAPKGTRTNWSTGENLKRLTEAIFA